MGYRWEKPLTSFKADCFSVVEDELADLQRKAMKKRG